MSDAKVTQNHSGAGHNIHAETVNFGRPEFILTPQIIDQIVARFSDAANVSINWIGDEKSYVMSERIAAALEASGVKVDRRGGIGMLIPPLAAPIVINGSHISVDASR